MRICAHLLPLFVKKYYLSMSQIHSETFRNGFLNEFHRLECTKLSYWSEFTVNLA